MLYRELCELSCFVIHTQPSPCWLGGGSMLAKELSYLSIDYCPAKLLPNRCVCVCVAGDSNVEHSQRPLFTSIWHHFPLFFPSSSSSLPLLCHFFLCALLLLPLLLLLLPCSPVDLFSLFHTFVHLLSGVGVGVGDVLQQWSANVSTL